MPFFAYYTCPHPPRLRAWFVLCCLVLLGWLSTPAPAQIRLKLNNTVQAPSDTVITEHVTAQLIALAPDGIAPGKPLELGLRIQHQPDWHTYWKNPGDSGLPTQLNWQLPAGMHAGEISWPTPAPIQIGDLVNYGYEGTVLLPVPFTIDASFSPQPDHTAHIQLQASWLVCRVECIPEEGTFQLQLPVDVSETLWASEFEAAHARAPLYLPDATAQFTAQADSALVALQVTGLPPAAQGKTLNFYPEAPNIFIHAAQLGKDWPQAWDGNVWTAQLPLSAMRAQTPKELSFVLATSGAVENHTSSAAWRLTAPVQGTWQAADLAEISPALAAALAANPTAATSSASNLLVGTAWKTWLLAVFGGLIGGLLLNLMPCVFPVLAIKLMGFSRHGTELSAQRHGGLAYAAGVILSFVALGGVLLALRAAGQQLGWGFQLQAPTVIASLAALFTLIGLNLAGVFELRNIVPDRVANLHARHPLADAFISGIVAVAIASPCTAPFMGASLGFAVSMPAPQALTIFTALGVGMALPYVLISWMPALLRWIPRPGPWMLTFRHAMAFPMLATVVWLIWVLGQQTGIDGAATLLALLLCLAALTWALTLSGKTRWILTALVVALSAWLTSSLGRNLLEPTDAPFQAASEQWQPWSPQRQADLLAQGRPVFVDYTAAWCVTCQYNKRTTLADPAILSDFAQRNVALLRADWTRRDAAITQSLTELGRNGVPVYVLLAPQRQPIVMTELLSRKEVHAALKTLSP